MLRTVSLVFTVWCCSVVAAAAQSEPASPAPTVAPGMIQSLDMPMVVRLVRSGPPGCEPTCVEWIAAQGRIDATSVNGFKRVLAQIGSRRPPVLIHSGGGSVPDAMEIARLIRAKGLDVAVSKTEFVRCKPADGDCRRNVEKTGSIGKPQAYLSICASACPLILAGGTQRYVGRTTLLGLHQISTFQRHIRVLRTFQVTTRRVGGVPVEVKRTLVAEKKISEKTVQTETKSDIYDRVRAHLVAMGVADGIMPLLRETPSSTMRWLKREELLQYRMATDVTTNGEQLIAALSAPKPIAHPSAILDPEPGEPGPGPMTATVGVPSPNDLLDPEPPAAPQPATVATPAPNRRPLAAPTAASTRARSAPTVVQKSAPGGAQPYDFNRSR